MNIILFDGVCNLCNSTVMFLIKHDKNNQLHFAAQQTSAGERIIKQYHINDNHQSVIIIKNELVYFKADAIIEIGKLLTGWPRILLVGVILPAFFRNWLYDLIAKNRYKFFGKREICSVPSKELEHKFIS
jgi:predicted DCC family thiol-disulfide oxidoreductase YuxK